MFKQLTLATAIFAGAAAASAQTPPEDVQYATDEMVAYLEAVGFTDVTYSTLDWDGSAFEVGGVTAVWPQGGALSMQRIRFENLRPDDRWLRTDGLEIDGLAVSVPGFSMGLGEFRGDDLHVKDIDSFRPTASFSQVKAHGLTASLGEWRIDFGEIAVSAQNWMSSLAVPGVLKAKIVGGIGGDAIPYERLSGDVDWNLSNYGGRARLIFVAGHEESGQAGFVIEVKDLNERVLWAWDDLNNPVILRHDEKVTEAGQKASAALSEVKVEALKVKGNKVPWMTALLKKVLASGELSTDGVSLAERILIGVETAAEFELKPDEDVSIGSVFKD